VGASERASRGITSEQEELSSHRRACPHSESVVLYSFRFASCTIWFHRKNYSDDARSIDALRCASTFFWEPGRMSESTVAARRRRLGRHCYAHVRM
jgi:hypothetical protein